MFQSLLNENCGVTVSFLVRMGRTRRDWVPVDLGDLTMDEFVDSQDDICSTGEPSGGRCYYKCSLHNRFPCKYMLRAFKCPLSGIHIVEVSGEHDHPSEQESFKVGLPFHVKKEIEVILNATPSAKPSQIRTLVRTKFPGESIPLKKVQGVVHRIRKSSKDIFLENTIGGLQTFVNQHSLPEGTTRDKLFVLDHLISEQRSAIVMSTFGLLSIVTTLKDLYNTTVVATDGTYKLLWNGFPLILFGVVDIMQQFHPVAFLFTSHEDSTAFEFIFNSVKNALDSLFNFALDPSFCISDNADEIFNAAFSVFPECVRINCYAHMIRNVRKKYKKHLKHKDRMDDIINQLQKIQSLSYEDDALKALNLFLEMNSDEAEFIHQFKVSYVEGFKKNWIRALLDPGVPCSNNSLERFNSAMKTTLTFHQRLSAFELLTGMVEWMRQISVDHGSDLPKHPMDLSTSSAPSIKTKIRDVFRNAQIENYEF